MGKQRVEMMTKANMPKAEPARDMPESMSVSVRKIANGWLASRSWSGPKGYRSEETYHEKRPIIDDGSQDGKESRGETMSAVAKAAGPRRPPKDT